MLLVVAADEGVKPQTREHLAICSLLGIPAGVAVLTKADLVGDDLLELAQLEVEERAASARRSKVRRWSRSRARTGRGLDELRRRLVELAQRDEPDATRRGRCRRGCRSTAPSTSRVSAWWSPAPWLRARSAPATSSSCLPGGHAARVRSVQVHGESREVAAAGERVSLQLHGVALADVARGSQARRAGRLHGDATAPGALPSARRRTGDDHRRWCRFAFISTRASGWESCGRSKVGALEPGGEALCEVRLDKPVVAARGDRFVVRRPSPQRTLGGGSVLDSEWPALRGPSLATALRALGSGDDEEALRHFVERAAAAGLELTAVARRFGWSREVAERRLKHQVESGRLLAAPVGAGHERRWIAPAAYRAVQERAVAVLGDYHAQQRMALGMPKAEAVASILGRRGAPLADVYLDWLRRDRTLRFDGERVTLPGRGSTLTDHESSLAERIAVAFEQRGLAAPSFEEIRAEVSAAPKMFEGLVRHLVARARLTRLPSGLFVASSALDKLRQDLLATGWERFGVGEFKDRFGLSRKWAIPLLEHLDAQGVTRRVGDERQVVRRRA